MADSSPLTIQHYKDLLARLVATHDNLTATERAGDQAAAEKLRAGFRQLIERARDATRAEA
ncbi:MAG TPA: hypothetical protein VF894_00545 [Anaeromyxobacter sp.]